MKSSDDILKDIAKLEKSLAKARELEKEAHSIWDNSFTNVYHCDLAEKMKKKFLKDTYTATEKHSKAMDILRLSENLLDEMYKKLC